MMKTEQAKKILKRFDHRLLEQTADCVGTAVVRKNNKWQMHIYIRELRDSHNHLMNLRFGEKARLAKEYDRKKSDELAPVLIVTGELKPFIDRTAKHRPAPGSVSIGHYLITAGTLSCVVYKPKDNGKGYDRFILSNNHVLANCNDAEIGDPILQPGPYDGGTVEEDIIGTLEDFYPIQYWGPVNYVDCAICKPTNSEDIFAKIAELKAVPDEDGLNDSIRYLNNENDVGLSVVKVGRTTGRTEGVITGFTGELWVDYGVGYACFDDQIVTEYIGAPGDSGSLLMDSCGKRAIGLLFAGSEYANLILYNKASMVASALGISFAPIPRIPISAGKIYTALIEGIKKICRYCCCPPNEPPPPPPPPCECCDELPDEIDAVVHSIICEGIPGEYYPVREFTTEGTLYRQGEHSCDFLGELTNGEDINAVDVIFCHRGYNVLVRVVYPPDWNLGGCIGGIPVFEDNYCTLPLGYTCPDEMCDTGHHQWITIGGGGAMRKTPPLSKERIVEIRQILDKLPPSQPIQSAKPVTQTAKLKYHYKLAVDFYKDSGEETVDEDTYIKRRRACAACPPKDKGECMKILQQKIKAGCAGCGMWQKLVLVYAPSDSNKKEKLECPKDKWQK